MYIFSDTINKDEHDAFILQHPLCNLLQTSDWAKVKDNWKHHIIGVYNEDVLVASASVLVKVLPFSFTMMYIPRGPIMDYTDTKVLAFFTKEMKRWAKKHRCLFVKMNPGILLNKYPVGGEKDMPDETATFIVANLHEVGIKHTGYTTYMEESIQPRFEACVVASEDFNETLPRHTKRLIKDAIKKEVQVVKAGKDRIKEFSDVVALTENRKNVFLRNHDYFMQLLDIYEDDCYLFLAQVNIQESLAKLKVKQQETANELASLQANAPKKLRKLQDIQASIDKEIKEFEQYKHIEGDKVIAGILSIKVNDTMEMLYAGMDDTFKKFMPQYYLYTENMNYAFEHGCRYANMGGVEGDFNDGLTKFKANFNPHIFEYVGEFDIAISPLYKIAKKAYDMRKRKNKKRG